ncbi:hypothetical protein [Rhizobium lentis]|uniref:Uncharacterized protein n=1 Tax=Rhizobium lentis TaxID=1138194 RepID=A0A9Q3M5K0_9HYPH|nr:hypothetical protein [Rhizobium lentis]MBX5009584.1 hypothetical protein [Rhizobium lentis]MBX5021990.1 hypothetical protein [Rhizobium lentis]
MEIELKEKTFEKYFGHELARLTKITFSPDQCDEALLGFDEAFFMPVDWFLRFGPYMRHRRRQRLTGVEIEQFNKHGKTVASHMPSFKLNLFVQFKRPTFLKSRGAKEWSDWNQSYYRYETMAHQQEALERIDAQSFGRAATIYASPAFWQAADLWEHVRNEAVVEYSNIASVGKLKDHEHYSYIAPGYFGKGHSETVDIKSDPLGQIIGTGFERNEPLLLNEHLKKTAFAIIQATSGSDIVTPVFQQVQTAMGFENLNPNSLYDAIAIIGIFSEAFGVRYYAMG